MDERGGSGTNKGDEAPRGTPGTGEDVCPECHGTGRIRDKKPITVDRVPLPMCCGADRCRLAMQFR